MKYLALILFLLLLATPAVDAQKLIFDVNGKAEGASMSGVRDWFCLSTQAPATQPLLIGAIEFPGIILTNLVYGIWSHNPTTGQPGTLLKSAKTTGHPYPIWQGGLLPINPPLLIKANEKFFVGYKNPDGKLCITKTGTKVTYYFNSNNTWRGPFSSYPWGFRLYAPGGTGLYTTYGKSTNGPAGPLELGGMGYPNTGNPVGFLFDKLPPSAPGLLLLGRHHPGLPLGPLGTIYPWTIMAFYPLSASNQTWKTYNLDLPTNSALIGATITWQGWFAYPTAPAGVIHTKGIDLKIG